MAHRMTETEYKQIRDNTYSLIYFNKEGRRESLFAGLSAARLIKETLKTTLPVLVMEDQNRSKWDREIWAWENENRARITLEAI